MARDGLTFDDLLFIARRVGVEVVAAPSSHRGKLGTMGTVAGVTLHHTGTPNTVRPTEDFPDYEVVKEGRVGLVNSLSAFGLGRWRCIYVFSEFLSWHAGTWLWRGITDGNGHFLGIEAAGIGDWTPWQRNVYPRLVASILLFIGEGVDMMPRHAEGAMPPGRKTDAANLWASFGAEVQNYLAHPEQININWTAGSTSEEDDMPQAVTTHIPTGEEVVFAFPPAGPGEAGGAAGWGRAWFSVLGDRFGKEGGDIRARIAVRGGDGVWRPAFGKTMEVVLPVGRPLGIQLAPGDNAAVFSDTDGDIGACVEYAKA